MERRKNVYERRKDDPVIVAIHDRLTTLESLSADMKEIKEWIATVVRMTLIIETVSDFIMKWIWRFVKFFAAVGSVWAIFKLGTTEALSYLRSFIK